ncbi:MAG: LysM peptidoglycan-binding domain-containing protein [Planctomycetes bacterium]|nr:LysM peptidoglycan-binding domain-containing protein [Planctomycetota bacterium]
MNWSTRFAVVAFSLLCVVTFFSIKYFWGDSEETQPGTELNASLPTSVTTPDYPNAGNSAKPVETAAPAQSQPQVQTVPSRTYTVAANDSLYSIAGRFLGASSKANIDRLMAANPQITDMNHLRQGQIITIPETAVQTAPSAAAASSQVRAPAPSTPTGETATYTVKKDEGFAMIARRVFPGHNDAVARLQALNPQIDNIDRVWEGQQITIPK